MVRFIANAAMWTWCALAHWLVGRFQLPDRIFMALLPFAGFYGFREPYMDWRWFPGPDIMEADNG